VVFTFMAPLLRQLTGAGPDAVGLVFATFGVLGIIGLLVASRVVDGWGGYKTSLLFTILLLAGISVWAVGAGSLIAMAVGVTIWGLGFASTNSMQQVRLVGAAPALATASVSLNTSVLYIGQALGSAIGGMLYARDLLYATGYVAIAFVALAVITVIATRRMSPVS
jgi:DHA1 family inner membrane transport protein